MALHKTAAYIKNICFSRSLVFCDILMHHNIIKITPIAMYRKTIQVPKSHDAIVSNAFIFVFPYLF